MNARPSIRRLLAPLLPAVALLIYPTAPVVAQADPLAFLDREIPGLLERWEVPGLAMAVIKDGEVAYWGTFGVKNVETGEPVDRGTIFAIGSATKSFTAALLATLEQDGVLSWDDPMVEHMPHFRLSDPDRTRRATIRDFVSQRTGLPGNNVLIWETELTRDELLKRIRHFQPFAPLGKSFQYANLNFVAAGEVVPAVTGKSWEAFVAERFFEPLGMTSTTAIMPGHTRNVASAHMKRNGRIAPIPLLDIQSSGPAGSIHSTVEDMAQWVKLWLDDGRFDGRRILESETIAELHTPHIPVTGPPYNLLMPASPSPAYAMGWLVHTYDGRRVVEHGGQTDGMSALVGMLPDEGIGVVVLVNTWSSFLPSVLMYDVFDAYLGDTGRDWNQEFLPIKGMLDGQLLQLEGMERAAHAAAPAHVSASDAAAYAGTYVHKLYGPAVVRHEDGTLTLDLLDLGFDGVLVERRDDAFTVAWNSNNLIVVGSFPTATFTRDGAGRAAKFSLGSAEFKRSH